MYKPTSNIVILFIHFNKCSEVLTFAVGDLIQGGEN